MQTNNNETSPYISRKSKIQTTDIVLIGMFASILVVISQISIPMPTGIPITIQVFGVALVGTILGWKMGILSTIVYILIGAIGIPVFANFRGGISVLTGMTGGYISAWPILAGLCGIRISQMPKTFSTLLSLFLSLIGLFFVELIGGLQWSFLSGDMTISGVFAYSLVAFIPKDIIITIAAVLIGTRIRTPLIAVGYIN